MQFILVEEILELIQVINYFTAKESLTVLQSRLINHNRCTLGLDTLHDTLNRTLTEVVAVALHGQSVHTNHNLFLLALIPVIICSICTSDFQHAVGDKVFTSSVALNDCFDQIFRHICVVCQQLLSIFRQTVTTVSERRIIVMSTNTRIKALLCSKNIKLYKSGSDICIGIVDGERL